MTHDELSELYELYALGVLDREEKAELEQHLADNCPQCQSGIRNALAFGTLLGAATEPAEPPQRLRRRILASVGLEPKAGRLWLAALSLATACLLIGTIVLSLESARRRDELASAQAQLRQSTGDLARLEAALRFLNEPETQQVVFGKGQPQPPRGRFFVNGKRGVLLMASNLPPAPAGKMYELWVLPKAGAPIPAGMFQSDAEGNAMYMRDAPLDLANTKAVAVTMEPSAGSPAPTSTPVIAAGLSESLP